MNDWFRAAGASLVCLAFSIPLAYVLYLFFSVIFFGTDQIP